MTGSTQRDSGFYLEDGGGMQAPLVSKLPQIPVVQDRANAGTYTQHVHRLRFVLLTIYGPDWPNTVVYW